MKKRKVFTLIDIRNPVHRAIFRQITGNKSGEDIADCSLEKGCFAYIGESGYMEGNAIGRKYYSKHGYEEVPLLSYIEIKGLLSVAQSPQPFPDHEIIYHDNGNIKVGCQSVSFDDLEAIYKHAHDLKEGM